MENFWQQDTLKASRLLNLITEEKINTVLLALADEAVAATGDILAANALDLAALETSNPLYDRLLLTPERIKSIANDIRNVATLPSPLGKILMETERPNGMKIKKISVPSNCN